MSNSKKVVAALLVIAGVFVVSASLAIGMYNSLVRSDQQVQSQWAQVENAYER